MMRVFGGLIAAVLVLAAAPVSAQSGPIWERPEFSLAAQDLPPAPPKPNAKRPWFAAGEIASINLIIWAYDRYLKYEPWSYIGWDTIKANFRRGLEWDRDEFSTNFFGHPYHGALFYNSARASGLSFMESASFTLGGSLMWEFFMENNLASANDLITTTAGGIFLGEILHRVSSLFLDDRTVGLERVIRELAGGIVDPARGLNRLFSGHSWRTRASNSQLREPIRGNLSICRNFLTSLEKPGEVIENPGLDVDFIYGQGIPERASRKPFDWFVFSGALRFGDDKLYGDVNSYALLSGRERIGLKGARYLTGLFQNFDYLVNEYFKMAGTSLTGGVVTSYDFPRGGQLGTSVQLGGIFGAGVNDHSQIEDRDYTYGIGPVLKVDAVFMLARYGTLSLRFGQFVIFTIAGTVSDETHSVNWVTRAKARYGLTLWKSLGVRLDLGWFRRSTQYEKAQRITRNQLHLGLSAVFDF
jgi:hypothetical protein